jgi:hypothetical protein
MAEDKTVEPIQLVAVERGFAMGRLVEPGEKFLFNPVAANGSPRKLPKWAAKPGDPRIGKPKPTAGDLKPKAAQAAVKQKAGALSGTSEPTA